MLILLGKVGKVDLTALLRMFIIVQIITELIVNVNIDNIDIDHIIYKYADIFQVVDYGGKLLVCHLIL
jgi:hypothetical protein